MQRRNVSVLLQHPALRSSELNSFKIVSRSIWLFLALLACISNASIYEQELTWKSFDEGKIVGDGVILDSITIHAGSGAVGKSFCIRVQQQADYFVSALMLGQFGRDYDVYVDGQSIIAGRAFSVQNGWQNAFVGDKTVGTSKAVRLTVGPHRITYSWAGPAAPEVLDIRLATVEANASLPEAQQAASLTAQYATTPLPKGYDKNAPQQGQPLSAQPPPPFTTEYKYYPEAPYTYTYNAPFNLSVGNVTFETKRSDSLGSDPVMYLFKMGDEQHYSWADDNGGHGYQSKIVQNITVAGWYVLMVRSKSNNPGTSDLWYQNSLYQSNITLGSQTYTCSDITNTGVLNYFTTYPGDKNRDTYLWLGQYSTSPLLASNDNFHSSDPKAFKWGGWSRIKQNFSGINVGYAFVSAAYPTGNSTCDVYLKCYNAPTDTVHGNKNLRPDDAIRSGDAGIPGLGRFNCISWSGGIYWAWGPSQICAIWPPSKDGGGPWYVANRPFLSFCNYYNNVDTLGSRDNGARYAGAWNYVMTLDSSTNEVDLWWNPLKTIDSGYSHASVRKPGNGLPHGYAWESKLSEVNIRIFHPRLGLLDTSTAGAFGKPSKFFKSNGSFAMTTKMAAMGIKNGLTLEESVRLGLTCFDSVQITQKEMNKIHDLIANIPSNERAVFDAQFASFHNAYDSCPKTSSVGGINECNETKYQSLLQVCMSMGTKSWLLLFAKIPTDEFQYVTELLVDLTWPQYRGLFNDAVQEWKDHHFTTDGTFIMYSPQGAWIRYAKLVLGQIF